MQMIRVKKDNWCKYRSAILQFVKYHNKSLRSNTYAWLFQLRKEQFEHPGTAISIALWEGKITAIAALSQYGLKHSLFIVSPRYKRTEIGIKLYEEMTSLLGVYYTKIDYQNIESIKMALNAGLVSFKYDTAPSGRLYLWFGSGHWHSADVESQEIR